MKNLVKTLTMTKRSLLTMETFYFIGLLSVAFLAPFVGVQVITGTLVNATLFIATILVGVPGAILIAFLPSVVALSTGLLPAVMAPMIPFIIAGNIILVLTFAFMKDRFIVGVLSASFLKFLFIYLSVSFSVKMAFEGQITSIILGMLSWPQLMTALMGGLIAYAVIRLKNYRE